MQEEELSCSAHCPRPYSDGIESVTALLVSCAVILMLFCLEWSFRNRNLLSHFFEYSIIFTAGSILATLALFSWPLNDSSASCYIKPLLASIGGGLMFGIFVARVRKVWVNFVWLRRQTLVKMRQAINSKRMEREHLFILGGILALQILLVLLFYAVPAFRPTCVCQKFTKEEKYFSSCSFNASFGTLVLCANSFPLALTAFYGYEILKEFHNSSEVQEYQPHSRSQTSRTVSFNTTATTYSNQTNGFKKSFSRSYPSKPNGQTLYVAEILGVRQDEIDEFRPILISVSAMTFLGLLVILFSVVYTGFKGDSVKRTLLYVGRTFIGLCITCTPVLIIYARAYSLVTLKQYKLRNEEEREDIENLIKYRGKRSMSERVVRAVASFRGTLPGSHASAWHSSQTNSTGISASGSSTNSFIDQLKKKFNSNSSEKTMSSQQSRRQNKTVRSKLSNSHESEITKNEGSSESIKLALS